jgi:hypothetical protein
LAETDSRHPTPTWPSPCPPWISQRGQHTTDRSLPCHFTAGLTPSPGINFPSQPTPRLFVHAALDTPFRRVDGAQSAQSAATLPAHTHKLPTRASHHRAQHRAPISKPPSPWPCVVRTDPR